MMSSDPHDVKKRLRRRFRERRRGIDESSREQLNQAIRSAIANHATVASARRIAAFLAFDGEPDLMPLMADLHARAVEICLPVLESNGARHLVLREWRPDLDLEPNHFGIREPTTGELRALRDVDVVLVPLVAWDRRGHRLGMGAGYYDRLFAAQRQCDVPHRIGVAYDVQEAESVPTEPWDVPLHGVVTERGWFTCPA